MKKSLLLGLGVVAMAMGIGAAVAGSFDPNAASEVQAAEGQTIYLKINNPLWEPYSLFAQIQSASNPYIGFVAVEGEKNLYSATSDLFEDSAFIKLVRGNKSGTYWGYSNEIKIGGFNYFIIDGDRGGNMDPGVGVYGLEDGTYLYGSFNNWSKHDGVLSGAVSDKPGYQVMFKDAAFPENTQMKVINVTDRNVSYGGNVLSDNQVESDDEVNYPASDYEQENAYLTSAGTYDVYVNTSDDFYSFVSPTTKGAAAAYGTYFLENVGCDPNGVNLPSGWNAVSGEYAGLSDNAKHIVAHAKADEAGTDLEKAMATYDYAIANNPNLKDSAEAKFITGRTPNGAASVNGFAPVKAIETSAVVIAAIVGIGLAAAGTMILVTKKRKKN